MFAKTFTILSTITACTCISSRAEVMAADNANVEKTANVVPDEGGIANAATCGAQKLVGFDAGIGCLVGVSTALDGDTLLLGAPWDNNGAGDDSGKVIAWKIVNGAWQQTPGPVPNNPQAGAFFGQGVGLAGDIAVVGACFHDNFKGTAYFFKRTAGGGVWTQTQVHTPDDIVPGDYFGNSAAINQSGDIAVFGAPFKDITDAQGTDQDAGGAYIYARNPDGTWSVEASLFDTDPDSRDPGSYFGYRVAISGEVAVIANRSDYYYVLPECGSVRVYRRNQQHQWNLEATLIAPLPQVNAYFGDSVAINGNQIAVGAVLEDSNGLINNGAVYMYRYDNGSWNFDGTIRGQTLLSQESFGGQVAVGGDRVLISSGDYMQQDNFPKHACMFRRASAGTWTFEKLLSDPDDNDNGFFGSALAMDGARFVVTDSNDDPNGLLNAGAAYVYTITSDDCANAAAIDSGSHFGCTDFLNVQMPSLCGPNAPSGPDAWFSYTAPCSGSVTIHTNGSSFDTVLSVHTSCPGEGGLTVACDDDGGIGTASQITFYPVEGATYKIRLAGYNHQSGTFVLTVLTSCPAPEQCSADIAPPPAGDDVVNIDDLVLLITNWGALGSNPADITNDNMVNIDDLVMVITAWGACP